MAEIEPRLFELAAKAREAQATVAQASDELSVQIQDRKIGEIYDPTEFKRTLDRILEHPLAAAIRLAREEVTAISVSVAQEIRDSNLLEQIKREHHEHRAAVESVEAAVGSGILPEDILTYPNVGHFRTRAQGCGSMLELYEKGIGLLPADETAIAVFPVPPAPERAVVSETKADKAERLGLLKRIHIHDRGKGIISIDDQPIHLIGPVNRKVFYLLVKDLKIPWVVGSLGVHSQDVQEIAERNGFSGKSPGTTPIGRLNEIFTGHGLQIHLASVKDPQNSRARYYRFRDGALPKRAVVEEQSIGKGSEPLIDPHSVLVFS